MFLKVKRLSQWAKTAKKTVLRSAFLLIRHSKHSAILFWPLGCSYGTVCTIKYFINAPALFMAKDVRLFEFYDFYPFNISAFCHRVKEILLSNMLF